MTNENETNPTKPKCAYIDHWGNVFFAMELRERGIHLDARATLDLFLEDFDLNDYPVLLYHPGVKQQHRIKEIIEKYPKTRVALVTAPTSQGDYLCNLPDETPFFTYNVDAAEKFIKENQT